MTNHHIPFKIYSIYVTVVLFGIIALIYLHTIIPAIFQKIGYLTFTMSIMFLRMTVKNLLLENDNVGGAFVCFKGLTLKNFYKILRPAVLSEVQDVFPSLKRKYPYVHAIPANPDCYSIHDEQICDVALRVSSSMNYHDRMTSAGKAAVWGNLTITMATLTLFFNIAAVIDDVDVMRLQNGWLYLKTTFGNVLTRLPSW